MPRKSLPLILGLVVIYLALAACSLTALQNPPAQPTARPTLPTATPLPTVGATAQPGSQPVQISGSFNYTNPIAIEQYYVEQAVALVDMHAFVIRDKEWLLPVEGQTLGYLKVHTDTKEGDFWLQLPAQPAGSFNDVDNNGRKDTGVQIFTVSYFPNQTGGPYSEGDDPTRGWPNYLASVKTDPENKDEVTGGKLVVWSPDDKQQFPTGFGPDGLLFTADDPEGPLPAGYSIINLDQKPFAILRDREPKLTLFEPPDYALKDFSKLPYTQAFDQMFALVRKEYAFNGIPNKAPDWDALEAKIRPRIQDAENRKDGRAFYEAMVDFTYAFKDRHVGVSSSDYDTDYFLSRAGGGYGLAIRELDDGRVIAVFVLKGGPAEQAGIQVGDQVTQFNGQPIADAISRVQPLEAPQSSEIALRYQQARYLLRTQPGVQAKVTFQQNGAAKTVTLTAVAERDSLLATSLYTAYDPAALPVEYHILPSNLGYVKVNSNLDDLNLIMRLFQRALKTFQDQKVTGVIIDLRENSGGAPLGLAGYLTDQIIPTGQLYYYSDKSGNFETEGPPDRFYPMEEQYRFQKLALLVGQNCYSACELEAYGFSQLSGIQIFGMYPTAGVEAEVSRGQFKLPEKIDLQIPTGRYLLPDGSLFLEGQGVRPNRRIPVTTDTVLSSADVVLQAAEDALK